MSRVGRDIVKRQLSDLDQGWYVRLLLELGLEQKVFRAELLFFVCLLKDRYPAGMRLADAREGHKGRYYEEGLQYRRDRSMEHTGGPFVAHAETLEHAS